MPFYTVHIEGTPGSRSPPVYHHHLYVHLTAAGLRLRARMLSKEYILGRSPPCIQHDETIYLSAAYSDSIHRRSIDVPLIGAGRIAEPT